MEKKIISIIGGGFCGTMTAVQLIKQATSPVSIHIINTNYTLANGVAYSAHTLKYLLNVPAVNMGAFPEAPTGFVDWLIHNNYYEAEEREIISKSFLPRKIYGLYLLDIWKSAVSEKPSFIDVMVTDDFAEDILLANGQYEIVLQHGGNILSDVVVLATGNSKPMQLFASGMALDKCKNYYANPWGIDCISNVKQLDSILIVGNGLTMIDTVLGLKENGFRGTIHTLSPNGFGLVPHRHVLTKYNLLQHEVLHHRTLKQLRRILYRHIVKVTNLGLSPELVIDALRPVTTALWQQLTNEEKKIFLMQLGYEWNIVRHRTPQHIYDLLIKMRLDEKFRPYSGSLKSFYIDENNKIHITYTDKHSKSDITLVVDRIINCTGPNNKLQHSDNLLLRNLATKGFIAPDALNLGIETYAGDYSIVDAGHHHHAQVFTLGSNLKGKLWESVAVPELRMQAAETAKQILSALK